MTRRLPPLNSLVAAEAALRHGSIRLAAEELRVTPSAVSQQVKALEEHFGVALLLRHPRGVTVTDAGRRILPGLSQALDQLDEVALPLHAGKKTTAVRLSLLPAVATGWFLPRFAEFRRLFPHFEVTLLTGARLVDFDREEVDFAIRYVVSPEAGLRSVRLMGEEVFPVASPRLVNRVPLPVAALRYLPLLHDVDADPGQPILGWRRWFEAVGVRPPDEPGLRFSDSRVLLEAAVEGLGVALGRGPLVEPLLARGLLVRATLEAKQSERSYFLVGPRRSFVRAPFRPFVEWWSAQAEPLSARAESE